MCLSALNLEEFQVVPPCGGHRFPLVYFCQLIMFQVVPPCGGHPGRLLVERVMGVGFKSCPRVGGIGLEERGLCLRLVSSRAPVWGASQGHRSLRGSRHRFKSCPRVGGIYRVATGQTLHLDVSSRAPVWGASHGRPQEHGRGQVSSRAPVWGASMRDLRHSMRSTVSSRAPVWGASRRIIDNETSYVVSSRAPVWGASLVLLVGFLPISSFKSCPRVGGIQTAGAVLQGRDVSSRAPVWGASDTCFPGGVISVVSSRAPVWGASC